MKIEKVSENMIKVTITLNDLEERNIDFNTLNYNSPAAQELFLDMMEQAEEQYGFNLSDSQLVIEPIPDNTEGFVITITKLDEDSDFESIQKYIKSRMRKSDLRVKRRNKRICSSIMIYCFNKIDDAAQLAKRLTDLYTEDSSLYKLKNMYYLVMTKGKPSFDEVVSIETIIEEYGKKVPNPNVFEGYLNEYGDKIIENTALENLRLFY